MAKRMLIDASHVEETRVVVLDKDYLEEFECETSTKKPIKGNIYLARVVRVEPSLQAAFVDFGSNRHGFLAFGEIHPDYYKVPVEDQEKLRQSLSEENQARDEEEDGDEETPKVRSRLKSARPYKIQEVIKKRQVLLVQVVKDERGGKGAALTTYLSLPGRYCVLMPNTPRGGGISRKITNTDDRKRLKELMGSLEVMEGAGLILRTAGMGRTKLEIKRDYDYLMRLWEEIRDKTLTAEAPQLIYEEGNLVIKAIRDLYSKEIEEVWVEGEESYKEAKRLMRILTPSHAKRVQLYKDNRVPLFHRYGVESKIDNIHHPVVTLPSGGYIVINPTEALVAIDVNSGRATRERHIEETALKTNLEASEEVARQLRLRDLAGLIVVDFIDMESSKANAQVEKRFRESLKGDRARIQTGTISGFGLFEMSRQRLRPSLEETISMPCAQCRGTGTVRSVESSSLQVLRSLEMEGIEGTFSELLVYLPTTVAFYLLNQKRDSLVSLEQKYDLKITVIRDDSLIPPDFRVEHVKGSDRPAAERISTLPPLEMTVDPADLEAETAAEEAQTAESSAEGSTEERPSGSKRRRSRRRNRGRKPNPEGTPDSTSEGEEAEGSQDAVSAVPSEDKRPKHSHQRPQEGFDRGGRFARKRPLVVPGMTDEGEGEEGVAVADPEIASPKEPPEKISAPSRKQRSRRRRPERFESRAEPAPSLDAASGEEEQEIASSETQGLTGLNRRGATHLKVGPGGARHFGRRFAKGGRETIRRVFSEDSETGDVKALVPLGEAHPAPPSATQAPAPTKKRRAPSKPKTVVDALPPPESAPAPEEATVVPTKARKPRARATPKEAPITAPQSSPEAPAPAKPRARRTAAKASKDDQTGKTEPEPLPEGGTKNRKEAWWKRLLDS